MGSLKFIILFLSMLILAMNDARASQSYVVKDTDSIRVKISSRELSRISMEGEGRIDKVWGADEMLEFSPDKEKGELFVRPAFRSPMAVSFFIRDSYGSTYTIIAEKSDIPSQTIVLKPKIRLKKVEGDRYKQQSLVKRVKKLIRSMVLDEYPSGYSVEDLNRDIPLWEESKIEMRKIYTGRDFSGEVYHVKNISGEKMVLHEKEFLSFGNFVLAVAIAKLSLDNEEETKLYIVRERK